MRNTEETRDISQSTTTDDEKRRDWHRGVHMTLHPLFLRKGYESTSEVDVSLQGQLIDIVAVRRMEELDMLPEEDDLPEIYWEVFENFNSHNLISFKSYSESFNGYSLMEFYGHLINYSKSKECKLGDINLYALVNHYPRKLLDPFEGTQFLTEIKAGEIYDLHLSTLHPVRFVICSTTDNPLLALFSGQRDKVLNNYYRIRQETTLFDNLSSYFDVFLEFFGEVISDMYTLEDFKRDYPPRKLPEIPEDLKGELWGVVMERLLEERVRARIEPQVRAEIEPQVRAEIEPQVYAKYQRMQTQFDKIQAESERIQAESERAQAEIKERDVEVIFGILNQRFGSIPVDHWLPPLRQCSLEQRKTLISQALKVTSVGEFGQLIEEFGTDTLSDISHDSFIQIEDDIEGGTASGATKPEDEI